MANKINSQKKTIYSKRYQYLLQQLRKARKEKDMKQETVADKIGKYQSYVSKIESGDRRLDVVELMDLADVYDKDIDYFVDDKKKKK